MGIFAFILGILSSISFPGLSYAEKPVFKYHPNPMMTTSYGPAKADIVLNKSNFVPCFGGPIALCYCSGPEGGDPDLHRH